MPILSQVEVLKKYDSAVDIALVGTRIRALKTFLAFFRTHTN